MGAKVFGLGRGKGLWFGYGRVQSKVAQWIQCWILFMCCINGNSRQGGMMLECRWNLLLALFRVGSR